MNEYLVNLLLKIHNCRMQGSQYVYKPEDFSNSEDALREEDGLLELRDMGYIKIIEQKNYMLHGITRYVVVLVDNITPRGNNFIRGHLAKENLQSLEGTTRTVPDIYQQTLSHLTQARKHIFSIDDERSRKDALRDCLSAMESLIKQVSGKNDVKPGTQHLRNDGYGPDIIVKDGLSVWNHIHDLHPDIRHGYHTSTDLPQAEALYWIERILAFINYLSRIKKA